jgi:hypothetical protein
MRVIRRSASKSIRDAEAAGTLVLDLMSRAEQPWVQFSSFYPHGGIPVPLSEGYTTACVEGAWQALKVFERQDVDLTKLGIRTMTGLKRSTRSFGRVLGHGAGVGSSLLLGYVEARRQIYLPLYRWVLEHRVALLVDQIRTLSAQQPLVFLDYETKPQRGGCDEPTLPCGPCEAVSGRKLARLTRAITC